MFKVAEGGATEDELLRAQNQLAGSTLLGLESADSWMSHMTRGEMHYGRQVSLDEITQGVRDVSLDAVTALAREFFLAETMTATVLGDLDGHSVEGSRSAVLPPAATGSRSIPDRSDRLPAACRIGRPIQRIVRAGFKPARVRTGRGEPLGRENGRRDSWPR